MLMKVNFYIWNAIHIIIGIRNAWIEMGWQVLCLRDDTNLIEFYLIGQNSSLSSCR